MYVTLRKNLEKLSNQLNVYAKKALENNKKKKNKNEKAKNNSINEEYKEKIEIKDKQINNSLAMINYLKRDNQKLKDTIELLKNSSTSNLNELIQSKENEINELINDNKELKKELNTYKYADKTINEFKKKNSLLRDTINRLNEKIEELTKKMEQNRKEEEKKKIKDKNSQKVDEKNMKRSASVINIKKDKEKEKNNFYSSGRNFYKLFNDNERKAISVLFNSVEDLNKFKQKISIIENRNNNKEKILKNDNKELSKKIMIKMY